MMVQIPQMATVLRVHTLRMISLASMSRAGSALFPDLPNSTTFGPTGGRVADHGVESIGKLISIESPVRELSRSQTRDFQPPRVADGSDELRSGCFGIS
jgi:hypothetical protein